jgi:hypothetical protein
MRHGPESPTLGETEGKGLNLLLLCSPVVMMERLLRTRTSDYVAPVPPGAKLSSSGRR